MLLRVFYHLCLGFNKIKYFLVLKVPPQFDFFTSLVSNSFCEKSNLPSIYTGVQHLYVVFVKSSDKLYLW